MSQPRTVLEDVALEPETHAPQTPPALRAVVRAQLDARMSRGKPSAMERLLMLAEVSTHAWVRTGRELPGYTRATMPVVVTTLDGRRADE